MAIGSGPVPRSVRNVNVETPSFIDGPAGTIRYSPWSASEDEPYFFARVVGRCVEWRGKSSCSLGHQLPIAGQQPEGIFASWTWDGDTLRLTGDRCGFYPLYFFSHQAAVGVSPSILKLLSLGAPAELDDEGLAVFLRLGFFIGDHTPFRSIRVMPPGAQLEWTNGVLTLSSRVPDRKEQNISRDEAIDRYIVAVRNAIRRRLPADGRFALPLSGGRDSRHLALELCASGYPPTECVTVLHTPPLSNGDALSAAALCDTLGLKHVILCQPRNRLNAEILKNAKTGMCTDEHTHYLPLADYVTERYSTTYDGIGGDTLTGMWYHHLEPGKMVALEKDGVARFADCLLRSFPKRKSTHEEFLTAVLKPDVYKRFSRDLAKECLIQELKPHLESLAPVTSFFFWNRTRREIGLVGFRLMDGIPNVFCPYLDHEVYDLLSGLVTIPDSNFRTDAIARAFPHARSVPYAESVHAPDVHANSYLRQFGRDLFWWAAGSKSSFRLVRRSPIISMADRAAFDADYAKSLFSYRWIGPHAAYLLQLEGILDQVARLQ